MLLLHQSKSYTCESTLPAPENVNLEKHHSLSLLDSIPVTRNVSSVNSSLSTLNLSLSNTSSSSSSSFQLLSHSFSKTSFYKPNNQIETSLNKAFIDEDFHQKQNISVSSNKKVKRRKDKKSKYKIVTTEIALFTVRRNPEHNSLYFLNTTDAYEDEDEILMNKCDEYGEMFENLSNDIELTNNKIRINKYNKKFKFKTLIKNKSILSMVKPSEESHNAIDFLKRVCLSKGNNCLCKNSSRLYIKYDRYKKLNDILISLYIPSIERSNYRFSTKRIDKSHLLSDEAIRSNKKVNAIVNRKSCDLLLNNKNSRVSDPPVVINNSLGEHHGTNSELNQTYDALYLEFLISIQHREITPEDYEYLSRLDEMVKKKTVSDNILKSLKCETITKEILEQIDRDQEVCGICLDQYAIEQVRKHLPCGHKFHADCIDNWLRNQSTNCPLDNISVDTNDVSSGKNKCLNQTNENFSLSELIDENSEEDFNTICQVSGLLDEIILSIENEKILEDEVSNFISDLIAKIES